MLLPIAVTIVLFVIGFGIKMFWTNLCVVCFSIAGSWILLLSFEILGLVPINPIALGIYMGGSAVGIMYYLSSRIPQEYQLFKFPFLLSLIFTIYSTIEYFDVPAFKMLLSLWVFFLLVYLFRSNSLLKKLSREIIKCCRDW